MDDALLVAQTCLKLDPYNDQVKGLVKQLGDIKSQSADPRPGRNPGAAHGK